MEYFNNKFNLPVGTRVKAALGNTMNTNRIQYECCWLSESANSVDLFFSLKWKNLQRESMLS